MSMTLANLQYAVKSRLAPDESSPAYTALHNDNITRWANEKTSEVILALEPQHYQALIDDGAALSFSLSGLDRKAALPSDYLKYVSIRVTIGTGLKDCFVFEHPKEYNRYDSRNFVLTPVTTKPIAKIMDGYIYVRPNTVTAGDIDYVKNHPTLSGSQDTLFSSVGDDLLIKLIVEEAMKVMELVVD